LKAFIIFRDRVTYGRQCVAAMDAAGLEPVVVDHGSTWPEAVDWLAELKKSGVEVKDDQGHPRELWLRPWLWEMVGLAERYVVNDPDVVPSDDCPADWLAHLGNVLDRHPSFHKAGLGLRIDRIPGHYQRRDQVIFWENQFWGNRISDGVFDANVDTTLALHVPLAQMGAHSFQAVRTDFPYVADHLAWYEDYENLSDELRWYHDHVEAGITSWTFQGKGAADHLNVYGGS
jgi:hypothetical protein